MQLFYLYIANNIYCPQELLSLLDQLDKNHQGWVSLEEFVQGLQAVRNTAVVTSTPSRHMHRGQRRRRHSDTVCRDIIMLVLHLHEESNYTNSVLVNLFYHHPLQ